MMRYDVIDVTNNLYVGRLLSWSEAIAWCKSYESYFPNRKFEVRKARS